MLAAMHDAAFEPRGILPCALVVYVHVQKKKVESFDVEFGVEQQAAWDDTCPWCFLSTRRKYYLRC
jgi:hypothetical protein